VKRTPREAAQQQLRAYAQASPGPYRELRHLGRYLVSNGVHVVAGAGTEPDAIASCADQADCDYVLGAYQDGAAIARALLGLQELCVDFLKDEGPNMASLADLLREQGVEVPQ
jgi:hypothetical protein